MTQGNVFSAPFKRACTIIPMTSGVFAGTDGAAPIRFSGCRDLQNYWNVLRGNRLMPARSEFDPRGIEQTLACTFIAEKVAPSVARIRVAGSQLNALLGMDVRGMPITAFFDPESRVAISEAMRGVFADPQTVTIALGSKQGFSRKSLHARMILLPMSDAFGQISRVVGCLEVAQEPGSLPRRFQVESVETQKLHGSQPQADRGDQTPSYPVSDQTKELVREFAEAPVEFKSARRAPPPKGAHLKLVVANA